MFEPRDAKAVVHESTGRTINAMTVDVEDYFHVSAFEAAVDPRSWENRPSRLENNVQRISELFATSNVSATFFVLGWVAERFPAMVRALDQAGHEIASHGMRHIRASEQTPSEFRQDVADSKDRLEQLLGHPVAGYRAASFSIGKNNLWALDVLSEVGYTYSSSVYPVVHDLYGLPEAPRFPFCPSGGGVLEIPLTTVELLGRKLPCSGGGYFRLLPYAWTKWAFTRVNSVDQRTGIFYFHPWEIDPGQPRVEGAPFKSRLRHYTNIGRMEGKLRRLLEDFQWGRVDEAFAINDGAESR